MTDTLLPVSSQWYSGGVDCLPAFTCLGCFELTKDWAEAEADADVACQVRGRSRRYSEMAFEVDGPVRADLVTLFCVWIVSICLDKVRTVRILPEHLD